MSNTESLDGTPREIKERLAREFPAWNIIVSSRGRWWASRGPLTSEELSASAIDTDDPEELRRLLTKWENLRGGA